MPQHRDHRAASAGAKQAREQYTLRQIEAALVLACAMWRMVSSGTASAGNQSQACRSALENCRGVAEVRAARSFCERVRPAGRPAGAAPDIEQSQWRSVSDDKMPTAAWVVDDVM